MASARLSRRARSSAARRESSAAKDVKELSETRSCHSSILISFNITTPNNIPYIGSLYPFISLYHPFGDSKKNFIIEAHKEAEDRSNKVDSMHGYVKSAHFARFFENG